MENNEHNFVRLNEVCEVEQSTVGVSFNNLENSKVENLSIENNYVTEVTETTEFLTLRSI